jgi:hypothetical protein
METEGSLPCLQEPAISLYTVPDESNPHLATLFAYYSLLYYLPIHA